MAIPSCVTNTSGHPPVVPFTNDAQPNRQAGERYRLWPHDVVLSKDLEWATVIADRIEAGTVHINDQSIDDEPHVTFGGVTGSGLGRYNGEDIMRKFAEECWISVQHGGTRVSSYWTWRA